MDLNNTDTNVNTAFGTQGSVDRTYENESWKGSIQRFYTDVSSLIEREGELIRTEMAEKAVQVKTASVAFVSAGVMLFIGALCLAATAMILLNYVVPLWAS